MVSKCKSKKRLPALPKEDVLLFEALDHLLQQQLIFHHPIVLYPLLCSNRTETSINSLIHYIKQNCAGGTMQLLLFIGTRVLLAVEPLAN